MATLVIKNIGTIVSGDINKPILEGSVIVVEDNLISAIGGEELLANIGDATVVDANNTTVTPGLWDTHVHVTSGDYGTRQKTVGYIESAKNGGVTTMMEGTRELVPPLHVIRPAGPRIPPAPRLWPLWATRALPMPIPAA